MNNGNADRHLVLPSWLVTLVVTLFVGFTTQLVTSVYWAGRISAQQEAHEKQLSEIKSELIRLRAQIERSNNEHEVKSQ